MCANTLFLGFTVLPVSIYSPEFTLDLKSCASEDDGFLKNKAPPVKSFQEPATISSAMLRTFKYLSLFCLNLFKVFLNLVGSRALNWNILFLP